MRVLSLAPTSFFNDYGCHVRIFEEARALQAAGHQVTILTYYKGNDVPGVEIVRTAPTPWRSNYEVGSSRHKFAFDVLLALKLWRELSRRRYDVIHGHLHEGALIGSVIGWLFGVPTAFDFQGSLTDEMLQHGFLRGSGPAYHFFFRLERVINRLPRLIFTSTRHAAQTLHKETRGRAIVQYLPDGVNHAAFRPDVLKLEERAALRERYGIAPGEFVVVFLGLLARHQGIQQIIEAAAWAKSAGHAVRWLVMGYPGVPNWQAVAHRAGVGQEVIFTGRVPYFDAPRMLALGDVAVAPKLSLSEGSGKILNYMAMGLPTVAFDTVAQREYLGSLGIYVPLGDSQGLGARVIELLNQPQRRRQLGEQLRQVAVRQFGWDRAAQVMIDGYHKLLARALPADAHTAVQPHQRRDRS
ncbi:MAG: glycosyltransferase family 4 protein [Anaerolineae bacterium]|nr:glycosyltransferase family 4 protein [Thermoflexales bacterium]MDW8395487.1 glycosyltransferase family 4 protein [Anaerolineae bacterium]